MMSLPPMLLRKVILLLLVVGANGFLAPRPVAALQSTSFDFDFGPQMHEAAVNPMASNLILADDFGGGGLMDNPIVSGLQSIGLIVVGLVGITFLLSVLVAVFLVPAAVKELEGNVKTQYPDLWNEYQVKLEDGETLATRPDLVQELGNKFQKLQMEQFDKVAASVSAEEEGKAKADNAAGIIDVEITSKDQSKD